MTNERGTSNVNYIPRNNNVLIKIEFTESILAITDSKPSTTTNDEEVVYTVAGIGPMVKDLQLGERVYFKLSEYISLNIKGNEQSIRALQKVYRSLPASELTVISRDKTRNRVKVIEYGLFPEFQISAHIE